MFAVLPDDELEMHLLSVFARTARQGVDRRAATTTGGIDPRTGLPVSANDLLPRYKAVSGRSLALQLLVVPRQLAASMLRRTVSEQESREGHVALVAIQPDQWTPQEAELVGALEEQIKLAVHRLAERHGWFDPRPNDYEDGRPLEGADGLTAGFKITPRGLEHALQRTAGTRWELGPVHPEHDLGRSAWSQAPQWAQSEFAGK